MTKTVEETADLVQCAEAQIYMSAFLSLCLLISVICSFLFNSLYLRYITAPAMLLVEWYSVFDKSTAEVAWLPALSVITQCIAGTEE